MKHTKAKASVSSEGLPSTLIGLRFFTHTHLIYKNGSLKLWWGGLRRGGCLRFRKFAQTEPLVPHKKEQPHQQ